MGMKKIGMMIRFLKLKNVALGNSRSFSTAAVNPGKTRYVKWPIPPVGTLKGNSDGSVKDGICGASSAFRVHAGKYQNEGIFNGESHVGKYVDGKYYRLPDGKSVIFCEGTSMLNTMKRADILNANLCLRLHFEGDNQSLIGAANKDNKIKEEYMDLVDEISEMISELQKKYGVCELTWVKGEANSVAHHLSRLQLDGDLDMPTVDDIPFPARKKVVEQLIKDGKGEKHIVKKKKKRGCSAP